MWDLGSKQFKAIHKCSHFSLTLSYQIWYKITQNILKDFIIIKGVCQKQSYKTYFFIHIIYKILKIAMLYDQITESIKHIIP